MFGRLRVSYFAVPWLVLAVSAASASPLTIDGRIEAQRAIEQVYWRHRIWPRENPGAKPSLEGSISLRALRAKVEDYLLKSAALEKYWGRPVTRDQLQAELSRMVRQTRDPELLRELFDALGDDPDLIAETLARPAIVDRLIHSWYARDSRFHGELRLRAQAAVNAHEGVTQIRDLGGEYQETVLRKSRDGANRSLFADDSAALVSPDEFERWRELIGLRFPGTTERIGAVSPLQEDDESFWVVALLDQDEESIRFAISRWNKRPFDGWWAGERRSLSLAVGQHAGFTLPPLSGAGCSQDDTWMETAIPEPRLSHTAVWTGAEMIVWGGNNAVHDVYRTGGRYTPATDTWIPTSSDTNVPASRSGDTAVWTGSSMIVWGGHDGNDYLNTGGIYDPATDAWVPTSTGSGVPAPRAQHTAVWTGTKMIVWGGDAGASLDSGGEYDPASDSWVPTAAGANLPSARSGHTAVWAGNAMIVWGGGTNTGGRYDPDSRSWLPVSTGPGVPEERSGHTAVWTGNEMIVWGGGLITGGRYDPAKDSWRGTSINNVPEARYGSTTVWTGGEMIVWGGQQSQWLNSGGRYNPATDTWISTSTGSNVPDGRGYHTAVWTGTEMIVWGGGPFWPWNSGGRYSPATDSWVPTSIASPAGRIGHRAVWTGSEMIVWGGGGVAAGLPNGGRYDPATDSWTPTATAGAPSSGGPVVWSGTEMIVASWGTNPGGRYSPAADSWKPVSTTNAPPQNGTAVWTGTEMIVWGSVGGPPTNSGARYNASWDTWTPTSLTGDVPSARSGHTAIWTGSEMIVWGGDSNSGARYDPASDSWMPTATGVSVPSGRSGHSAVWTGTEMIVWGGQSPAGYENTGGRYTPATDSWLPTSTGPNVPAGRADHTAVWTGHEMVVWGAYVGQWLNTGGRYDPVLDAWMPTSTAPGVPLGREGHTAVWTGKEMIVWGGIFWWPPATWGFLNTGGRYCACQSRTWYRDQDGDGYGDASSSIASCSQPADHVTDATDCDDLRAGSHDGAPEVCDGLDNDCDAQVDEDALGSDTDGDGILNLCDDCVLDSNPTQADLDGDLEGDACDLDDGLIYVGFREPGYVEWQAEIGFEAWNAYRGDLPTLRSSGQYTQSPGSNLTAQRTCGTAATSLADPFQPPAGSGAFYLTTGIHAGGESGLGTNSAGLPRPNAHPCP